MNSDFCFMCSATRNAVFCVFFSMKRWLVPLSARYHKLHWNNNTNVLKNKHKKTMEGRTKKNFFIVLPTKVVLICVRRSTGKHRHRPNLQSCQHLLVVISVSHFYRLECVGFSNRSKALPSPAKAARVCTNKVTNHKCDC